MTSTVGESTNILGLSVRLILELLQTGNPFRVMGADAPIAQKTILNIFLQVFLNVPLEVCEDKDPKACTSFPVLSK